MLYSAVLVSDDTLFNAALVSFGSFGIIHGLMIETRDRFLLRSYRRTHAMNADFWNNLGTLNFDNINLPMPKDKLYHFEVFFNPNAGSPPAEAIVMMMFEEDWHDYTAPAGSAHPGSTSWDNWSPHCRHPLPD